MRCLKAHGARIAVGEPARQIAKIQIRVALINRFWLSRDRRDRKRHLMPKGKGAITPHTRGAQQLPWLGGKGATGALTSSLEKGSRAGFPEKDGAGEGTRTPDPIITNAIRENVF